jgi:ferric-dicitrate binding protein FerR (iron transport regulator)
MQNRIKDILQKGKVKGAKETDRQEMLNLFHQSEKEFELKGSLLEEIADVEESDINSVDFKRIFETLWLKIERSNSSTIHRSRFLNTFIKVAAAIFVGLFLGYFANTVLSISDPVYYTAHSPRGSISEVVMPDGTVIFLNSDTQIKYSVNGIEGKREVFLNGEAWFEVHKDKSIPFVVHTPFYNVNVTGTKFNVKAYDSDDDITTTLTEGRVVIESANDFRLANSVVLKPGQQLVLNRKTKKVMVKNVNTQWYTSWKDNKLIFVNMSLKDFTVILERKYGVDIEISEKSIIDLHIDCTIKNESILEILDIIQKTLPVKYKITGQKIKITKK